MPQREQVDAPNPEYVPAGQKAQAVFPDVGAYLPAGHDVHEVVLAVELE